METRFDSCLLSQFIDRFRVKEATVPKLYDKKTEDVPYGDGEVLVTEGKGPRSGLIRAFIGLEDWQPVRGKSGMYTFDIKSGAEKMGLWDGNKWVAVKAMHKTFSGATKKVIESAVGRLKPSFSDFLNEDLYFDGADAKAASKDALERLIAKIDSATRSR